ncbi:MAG: hypothetical protein ACPLTR_01960 [Thermacetogeniaceae bacterium]
MNQVSKDALEALEWIAAALVAITVWSMLVLARTFVVWLALNAFVELKMTFLQTLGLVIAVDVLRFPNSGGKNNG